MKPGEKKGLSKAMMSRKITGPEGQGKGRGALEHLNSPKTPESIERIRESGHCGANT